MSKVKVNVYNPAGVLIGYFADPQIHTFAQGEYEISGHFFDGAGQVLTKIDFNPEAVPYMVDLSPLESAKHKRLKNVYVQRGRQPVKMTGCGETTPARS
jgi:hypothetical protein